MTFTNNPLNNSDMKVFDLDVLKQGKVEESILVKSYQEYQDKGGKLDILDAYATTKDRAKMYEDRYIQGMDMACSGIPVEESIITKNRLLAQVFWTILHLWFNRPLRKVSYSTFDLDEFNKL